ncbi:hypothetical protein [Pseudooceanicola sp. 200-1SW]|uniref:hypothetical protein n=1 Tax=Pseudooceanicola sp. 200-1SW TaxID=3425949 RepID=UPI003D7F4789
MSEPRPLVAYTFAEALPGLAALAILLGAGVWACARLARLLPVTPGGLMAKRAGAGALVLALSLGAALLSPALTGWLIGFDLPPAPETGIEAAASVLFTFWVFLLAALAELLFYAFVVGAAVLALMTTVTLRCWQSVEGGADV